MPHSAPTPPPPCLCPARLGTSARIPSFLFTHHHSKACQLFTHAHTHSHARTGEGEAGRTNTRRAFSATYKHRINLYNLICHENTRICKYSAGNSPPNPPHRYHTQTRAPTVRLWPGPVPPVGKFEEFVGSDAHTLSSRLTFSLVPWEQECRRRKTNRCHR